MVSCGGGLGSYCVCVGDGWMNVRFYLLWCHNQNCHAWAIRSQYHVGRVNLEDRSLVSVAVSSIHGVWVMVVYLGVLLLMLVWVG